jgi:hypothetical protein
MEYIKQMTHESFNFDEKVNPLVKALIGMKDNHTSVKTINQITGENFVKIHEQHVVLENLAKNIIRAEIEMYTAALEPKRRALTKIIFSDMQELIGETLDYADSIIINKIKYTQFNEISEELFSLMTTEIYRTWREFENYLYYIDGQFEKYMKGIHEIVLLKCPTYVVKPVEGFPNIGKYIFVIISSGYKYW